jgi:hypothetical protein
MTPEQAKELLPIIQAFADGKSIQFRVKEDTAWEDHKDFEFCWRPERYRIKPEQAWRAWTEEDILNLPLDAIFQDMKTFDKYILIGYLRDRDPAVRLTDRFMHRCHDMKYLLDHYTYSLDHGVTWRKCGVLS